MTERFSQSGFDICDSKGFRITFENGWTLSVQFGPYNYCEHYNLPHDRNPRLADQWHSSDAETAIINPKGNFVNWNGEGEVQGNKEPADIPAMIAFVASQEPLP